jgi:hypothetical protein
MDKIIIFDNFLSVKDLETIKITLLKPEWSFQNKLISDGNFFWKYELKNNSFFTSYLKNKITVVTGKQLKLHNVYARGCTYGQKNNFCQDNTSDKFYNFCLYANDIIKSEFDSDFIEGHLEVKVPNLSHALKINTIYNRGIFFPSNFLYKNNSFSRFCVNLCITLIWQFEIE